MRTIELKDGRKLTNRDLNRAGTLPREVEESAQAIVDAVRERGDEAVRGYCMKFDGACPQSFLVPKEVVEGALDMVDPEFLSSLRLAYQQIRDFHQREVEQSWFTSKPDGTILGVKVTPVPSVAVYVPGGRAQYPSTVLMDTIPAKVAGVKRVIMVTPPQRDGSLSAYTLAAAAVAGVDEVYAVGGAQAIGAVAYGTETIPKVAKIVGPGNAFVAAAKRYVSGDVGIDMVAGPSEVCVLADATADPVVVAADLMAQAEHDPMASCYLVTDDPALPGKVTAAIERLVSQSPREDITRASLDNNGVIVLAEDLAAAVDAVNVVAPEHLELHCANAFDVLGSIQNAGAIFVGPWSSEPLGRHGGLLQSAGRLRLREAVLRHKLLPAGPAQGRPRRAGAGPGRGPVGARALGRHEGETPGRGHGDLRGPGCRHPGRHAHRLAARAEHARPSQAGLRPRGVASRQRGRRAIRVRARTPRENPWP